MKTESSQDMPGDVSSRAARKALWVCVTCVSLVACSNADRVQNEDLAEPRVADSPINLTALQVAAAAKVDEFTKEQATLSRAEDLAKKAMERVLFDPRSATFSQLSLGRDGAICGKVNAKNRYGAYVGLKDFVVEKDGEVSISSSNDGVETERSTYFAASYIEYCATKQEKAEFVAATESVRSYQSPDTTADEPDAILDAPVSSGDKGIPTTTT